MVTLTRRPLVGALSLGSALANAPGAIRMGPRGRAVAQEAQGAGTAVLPGFHHSYADVEGARVHYLAGGRGEPLVLLHGWPVTSYAWREVLPLLVDRYAVVAPDMPGFADSGPSPAGYEKRAVARIVRGLVRQLGHERVCLAGHDVGGPVAYAYAAQYRDEVRHLALIETILPGFGLEDLKAVPAWHMGFAMAPGLSEALVAGRERAFLEYFYRRGTTDSGAITSADLAEYVRAYTLPGRMAAGFEYYRALPRDAEQNRVHAHDKLAVPVLAVGAGQGVRTGADLFRPVASDVREAMIADSGHHVPDDRPAELAAVLRGFFGEGR